MNHADSATLYPRYCFHLAPTANTWCLLRTSEIHDLDQHAGFEGENFYFYKNIPIKWVRIVGVIVGMDNLAGRRFYYVDDSSGVTIQALYPLSLLVPDEDKTDDAGLRKGSHSGSAGISQDRQALPQKEAAPQNPKRYSDIDVGSVVDIKGSVSTFRNERQINIEKMELIKGTARELLLWEKRARFRRDVLDVPWVLTESEVRRCRREAEGFDGAKRRKKRHDDRDRGDHNDHQHGRKGQDMKKLAFASKRWGSNENKQRRVSFAEQQEKGRWRETKDETRGQSRSSRGKGADHGVSDRTLRAAATTTTTTNTRYSALGL